MAAPAVLNAYFAATGKRIRTFPPKNHGVEMVEDHGAASTRHG